MSVEPLSPSAPQPLSPSAPQPKRVLLVDDDNASQNYEAKVLEQMGLEVDVASNGAEAIKFLSQTDYALVLMDCLMPVMDGIEATKRIRDGSAGTRNPDILIIAITADAMPENLSACKLAGMNDWMLRLQSLGRRYSQPLHAPLLLAHLEPFFPSKACDPFRVHLEALPTQQRRDPAIAVARMLGAEFQHLLAHPLAFHAGTAWPVEA